MDFRSFLEYGKSNSQMIENKTVSPEASREHTAVKLTASHRNVFVKHV